MHISCRHALALVWLVGCASPMSALRDDNRRLTDTVAELRTERRAIDRKMRDLQHQLDKLRADRATAVIASLPTLPVEVATPASVSSTSGSEASRVVAVADDGTEIVYEGDAASGRSVSFDDTSPMPTPSRSSRARGGDASIDLGPRRAPSSMARASRSATRSIEPVERVDEASAAYRKAVELVKVGSLPEAVTELRSFLETHPRHDYADNAQYWLGEAFYAQKDYPRALTEFRNVIETYPRGNKVPDALLKVGFCYHALGQAEKARAVLEQVVNLYPKTEPAALAAKRLETP